VGSLSPPDCWRSWTIDRESSGGWSCSLASEGEVARAGGESAGLPQGEYAGSESDPPPSHRRRPCGQRLSRPFIGERQEPARPTRVPRRDAGGRLALTSAAMKHYSAFFFRASSFDSSCVNSW